MPDASHDILAPGCGSAPMPMRGSEMRGPSARRDNAELTTLRGLARFRSMSLLCAMQMVFLPVYSVRVQAQTANVVTPDGRTGTSLQTSGGVTNVTTSTVSGNNAFNSFS